MGFNSGFKGLMRNLYFIGSGVYGVRIPVKEGCSVIR